jgi:hypothetical protein
MRVPANQGSKNPTIAISIERGHAHNESYQVERPENCPSCHRYSQITVIKSAQVENDSEVEAIFRCGYDGCKRFFIGYYRANKGTELLRRVPLKPVPPRLPDIVSTISPKFLEVYGQAESAHAAGLHHIAGPGYRKALEFLIKDYAVMRVAGDPDKDAKIEKILNGKAMEVVREYCSGNPNLQDVAERAFWLGNDETHYMRIWEEHDISDLIDFIVLTANWFDTEKRTAEMVARMPPRKK